MKDEYFESCERPRGPLVSDRSVKLICGTTVVVTLAVLAGFRPELGEGIAIGSVPVVLILAFCGFFE